jgi:molecular chaperone IbpA
MEDLAMRTYDFSPLWRSTIGFDRLFDLAEAAHRAGEDNYPPYNIERLGDDRYQISLAVAGFSPDEIAVTAEQNVVTIEGNKSEKAEREFLYRGISTRTFKRQFNLADYVQVRSAAFDNGLLKIELVREIARGDEAAADRHRRRAGRQHPAARSESGLKPGLKVPRGKNARHTTRPLKWRNPCGRPPRLTTMFSTSRRCFTPAPCSNTPKTWSPIQR